jgi:hypothetical protein
MTMDELLQNYQNDLIAVVNCHIAMLPTDGNRLDPNNKGEKLLSFSAELEKKYKESGQKVIDKIINHTEDFKTNLLSKMVEIRYAYYKSYQKELEAA